MKKTVQYALIGGAIVVVNCLSYTLGFYAGSNDLHIEAAKSYDRGFTDARDFYEGNNRVILQTLRHTPEEHVHESIDDFLEKEE